MPTKATLLQENKELIRERKQLNRLIKVLKKRLNNPALKGNPEVIAIKDDIIADKSGIILALRRSIESRDSSITDLKRTIKEFSDMSWFERLFYKG